METNDPLAEGTIGFTVNPPESWGTFSTALFKASFPDSPGLGEDREYRGSFSGEGAVVYRAVVPGYGIAREGYAGDILGYVKKADGYYVRNGNGAADMKVPASLIIGEVPLVNGSALLLRGPETSDGPSFFPNTPGQLVAYLNTPKGPVSGGVFMTFGGSPTVTVDEMKAMLATVTIK